MNEFIRTISREKQKGQLASWLHINSRVETVIGGNMKREDQQDATIRCLLLTSVSTCFGHHYAHLQEKKGPVTAFAS